MRDKNVKEDLLGVGTNGREKEDGDDEGRSMWLMYFMFL
jgi:hypothetical protein